MDGSKVPPSDMRKSKKKQVKDEMDRIKQAEKKRRRLEKALATSAAIRSELEKKKQKKKEEEQQRLDEEGAAIAEAVALNVLLGEEDLDDSRNKDEGLNEWDNFDIFLGRREEIVPYNNGISKYWLDGIGWVSNPHQYGCLWDMNGNAKWMVSSGAMGREVYPQYLVDDERWHNTGISSAGLIAAQAVSSLHIAEEEDSELDKYVFKPRC